MYFYNRKFHHLRFFFENNLMSSQPFDKKHHLYKKASLIAMSKIKKGITFIVLLITSICFSQKDSISFKNYNESQEWIEKVRLLSDIDKKNEILKKIETNNNLLPIVIENHIYYFNKLSESTKKIIQVIDEKHFDLIKSSVELRDPEDKVHGVVIIQLLLNPIINITENIEILEIKKKKRITIIKLNSLVKTEVKISTELLLKNSSIEDKNIQIRKGENRLKIKNDNQPRIISITNQIEKIIFIK